MVWEQKIKRASRDGGSIDWIVMRNRLSSLDARNKRRMAKSLHDLALRIGFRVISGFGERVIYRQLFLKGLTLMDLRQVKGRLNLSHVAARQEVRRVLAAVGLPPMLASAG
jgi:chromosome partitioning protein